MAYLLHILLLHHSHAFFVHGVKNNFHISKLSHRTQKGNDLIFFKIMKQPACSNENRSIGKFCTNLSDPVFGKGISCKIGFSFQFREQFPPVVNDMRQIHGIPACPSVITAVIGCLQATAQLDNHTVRSSFQKRPNEPIHIGRAGGRGQKSILVLLILFNQVQGQLIFQFQCFFII